MTASVAPGEGSLADDLARLEAIVRQLEGEALDLDGALALFEEGVQRLQHARQRLAAAELRVQQVLADAADALGTEPGGA